MCRIVSVWENMFGVFSMKYLRVRNLVDRMFWSEDYFIVYCGRENQLRLHGPLELNSAIGGYQLHRRR